MVTLVIVEDEYIIREGLKNAMPWQEWGVKVIGTASNGADGLELVKQTKPDIVLTDIRMPKMNGLEMLAAIKEVEPDTEVVLLSGYDDFEYAKNGLNLGAKGYILKLNLSHDLERMIKKVAEVCEEKKKHRQREREKDNLVLYDQIRQLLLGYQSSTIHYEEEKKHWNKVNFQAGVVRMRNYYLLEKQGRASHVAREMSLLEETARSLSNGNLFTIRMRENELVIVHYGSSNELISKDFTSNMEEIIRKVEKEKNQQLSSFLIGVGSIYKGLEGLYTSYKEAKHVTINIDLGTHLSAVEVYEKAKLRNSELMMRIKKIEEQILDAFEHGSQQKGYQELESWFEVWKEECHVSALQHMVLEFLYLLIQRIQDTYGYDKEIEKLKSELLQLRYYETSNDLEIWMRKLIKQIMEETEKHSFDDATKQMHRIIRYIDQHITEKITLKEVSEHMYLNTSYLSVLFKRKMNKTFTDYVVEKKIEIAADLIRNGHKVQDAAHAIGYDDMKHFRKMFRKYKEHHPGTFAQKS
ncbi:response regulator [Guptibacillus hwajinpoensis]|uniref:response regulator n=1 Tax=Guptibacillus hwajinpoensis TaxID=208199 RepID=UPI001CD7EE24|nr:response regulator [Pseudalkalibacillus hwajinpoensis]MCA0991353.1 response regulator [Pseudalkalibacillus hwajinpoensis]